MFCKYNYMPASSTNDIKNDILAILTGETNVNNLSQSCVKSNSLIVKTQNTPAGWEQMNTKQVSINESTITTSAYWKDVTFGLGNFFMCGPASTNAAGTFLQYSADGSKWTVLNSLPSAPWSKILYNGNDLNPLFVAIAGGDSGSSLVAASSTDGKLWVQRALPVSQSWGTLAFRPGASPLWLALPKETGSAVGAISSDGTTWTQIALPISMSATGAVYDGEVFWITTYSTTLLYKFNGTTWTGVTLPGGQYYSDITYGNGTLVLTPHEQISTNATLVSINKGLTWVSVTLPETTYWRRVIFTGTMFIAGAGGSHITNTFAISYNGIDWFSSLKTITSTYYRDMAFGNNVVCIAPGNGSLLVPVISFDSTTLKALNEDSVSYKYINVDIKQSKLLIRSAELFGNLSTINLCKNSNSLLHAQQVDVVNGGIIFIGASERYVLCLSYKPSTSSYGSSSYGSFSGVVEFSRDDIWSTTYPAHAFISSNDFSTCYVPRTKSSIDSDVKDELAFLSLQPNIAITKQILSNIGDIPQHLSVDLRLSNTATYTYTVLGGIVLGGIKRTTDGFSITADEVIINNETYFVMSGGTSNPNFRLLIPKF